MSQIYALSDDILTPPQTIISQAEQILSSGVKLFQYRCKNDKFNEDIAKELLVLCSKFNATFIINDDVDFAAKIGTNAVHIGKDDASLAYARAVLGDDAFIGVSCYDSLELAKKAEQNGASYVAFGAIFASKTKPNANVCGLNILKQAKANLSIPICAIGGINLSNIALVSQTGIDYIAVVNAIYSPNLISKNLENLNKAIL